MTEKNSYENTIKEIFTKAYNNFDPKELKDDSLDDFYVETFSQSCLDELVTTIDITEQYRKMLLIGHRGCGKSTILNKICQTLKSHTVVAFSATDVVNISEIEAIDILLATYLQILETIRKIENEKFEKENKEHKDFLLKIDDKIKGNKKRHENLLKKIEILKSKGEFNEAKIKQKEADILLEEIKNIDSKKLIFVRKENGDLDMAIADSQQSKNSYSERIVNMDVFHKMTTGLKDLFKKLSISIDLNETSVDVLGLISFKYRVESETRSDLRFKLKGEIKELQRNIHDACTTLNKLSEKDILIIIDDLDKLTSDVAKKVFFENFYLLSDTPAKFIYAFPLDTYYDPDFNKFTDLYEEIFIPICNIYHINGEIYLSNKETLYEMVYKRIPKEYVNEKALSYLVEMSGGLLRDLIKFMQQACKLVITGKISSITEDIANIVIERNVNSVDRVFDSFNYKTPLFNMECDKHNISKSNLIYLLHNLFALEYREKTDVWYIIHPCLKKALIDE